MLQRKSSYILGVSMSNHDRSACLIKDGEIKYAISEERIDRRKKSEGFYDNNSRDIVLPPFASITYVLNAEKISIGDVDLVICGRSIKSCREEFLTYFPIDTQKVVEIDLPSHHLAHAYSAAVTSPYNESAVLVIDEQGHLIDDKYEKYSLYKFTDNKMQVIEKFYGTKTNISLGMYFDIFASLIALSEAGKPAAGKLMGLASKGKKNKDWPKLIEVKNGDTNIPLNRIDDFLSGVLPIKNGMEEHKISNVDELLNKFNAVYWDCELAFDLAYKAQEEVENAILEISSYLFAKAETPYMSYAGGVALNCTANSRLLESGWSDIYVHPAATDDGISVGLALYGWNQIFNNKFTPMKFNPFTGKNYSNNEILVAITEYDLQNYCEEIDPIKVGAELLANNNIVCWFQGRSEWGPRALGARSILANPNMKNVTNILNSKIKLRESFRPFGISCMEDEVNNLLDVKNVPESLKPFMLAVGRPRNELLKGITHVDGTIRFQTINSQLQPLYYRLIERFKDLTGIGAVVNTSFNVMGEPLVETPKDAVRQFVLTEADVLILGNYMICLKNIPLHLIKKLKHRAFKESHINVMKLLLNLEALGYYSKITEIVELMDFEKNENQITGVSNKLTYHSFMTRYFMKYSNIDKAKYHANLILKWSSYSGEAKTAVDLFSIFGNENEKSLSILLNQIICHGEAVEFFDSLLEKNVDRLERGV